MTNQSFLTFTLHGLLLAIDTKVVRKIIWLPELTLIEECPSYIAGVINLRGKILPVMDLNVRFGHAAPGYQCSDRVIILGVSEFIAEIPDQQIMLPTLNSPIDMMGIIVNEVLDVLDIPEENIEPPPFGKRELKPHPHFVSGEAKAGEDIVMILNPRTILDSEFELKESEIEKPEIISESAMSYFSPGANQQERKIFRNRAINLQQASDGEDSERVIPVAVISLSNECVGVELEAVREFSKIRNFTPVPCCPEHIAGNMNLRGNVLTVIDISSLLNVATGKISESTKVIVADSGEFPVGVIVDEILDVIYLGALDIVPVSASIRALNEKFVKGAAFYGSGMMAILDFKEILSWNGLLVDEEV
jgi:purine-binding chemotaxis protein CheW